MHLIVTKTHNWYRQVLDLTGFNLGALIVYCPVPIHVHVAA